MTKHDLSQLYHLTKEIDEVKQRILDLESLCTSGVSHISGMPSRAGMDDKVARYAVEIADLKVQLEIMLVERLHALSILTQYINSVQDSQIRLILSLRYIQRYTWTQVAAKVGGGNSDKTVQMAVGRHLKRVGLQDITPRG